MNSRAEQIVRFLKVRRELGLRTRRKRLPRQLSPKSIEREYASDLLRVVEETREQLRSLLQELPRLLESARHERKRVDAGEGKRVRELIDRATENLKQSMNNERVEDLAQKFAFRTASWQRIQLEKQTRAALGADVFISDRKLPTLVEGFVAENVALIKNVPVKIVGDIERAVTRGVQNGTLHKDLAKEIEDIFGVGENRAKLIARDQVGKLYGQINAARQTELGVEEFIWRTVNDQRVREEHVERDGQKYSYDDPPDGELPGEPINCRCYAEPVFDKILEEV